jgi:hypothetical protein
MKNEGVETENAKAVRKVKSSSMKDCSLLPYGTARKSRELNAMPPT